MPSLQVRGRVLLVLWIGAVVAVSLQASANHNNNFEIFRTSFLNLVGGTDLYAASPRHQDFFKYSPTFALLFAPFALGPFWVGVLLWNAANAIALYWGLGRVLDGETLFAARALVFMDTVGAMQNVQSNALVAGLMIIGCAELDRRREMRAALAIAIGTAVKIFPIVAAVYAIFRPYRVPRFAAWGIVIAAALVASPLIVLSPAELAAQYRSWGAIQQTDALTRGHSLMFQLQQWFTLDLPNWPVQLIGVLALLAPLIRLQYWGVERFRMLFLASLLMFCVLFNHKAESPTFVVALAGVALWFAHAPRTRLTTIVLWVVIIGTVLSSSDAMPRAIQESVFEPYRLKILPVFLVWMLTQVELWRQSAPAQSPPTRASRELPAT
jgi:hypothetical protein